MSKKKRTKKEKAELYLGAYGGLGMVNPMGVLNGLIKVSQEYVKVDEYALGEGLRLVPTEFKKYKGDSSVYCHIANAEGEIVNDGFYRKGGIGGKFKDGYCQLINYTKLMDSEAIEAGESPKADLGTQVLINTEGQEAIRQKNHFEYLYHVSGVIAVMKEDYYNLLTGELIVKGSESVRSKEYIFVKSSYFSDFKEGVYQIEYKTGKVTYIK